jgi:hypothetical protein
MFKEILSKSNDHYYDNIKKESVTPGKTNLFWCAIGIIDSAMKMGDVDCVNCILEEESVNDAIVEVKCDIKINFLRKTIANLSGARDAPSAQQALRKLKKLYMRVALNEVEKEIYKLMECEVLKKMSFLDSSNDLTQRYHSAIQEYIIRTSVKNRLLMVNAINQLKKNDSGLKYLLELHKFYKKLVN